jgi:hypothetical protein
MEQIGAALMVYHMPGIGREIMSNDGKPTKELIDQFFSGPGGRADDWRDLLEAAKTWVASRVAGESARRSYEQIGRGVRMVARGYRDMYEASKSAAAK